jgi:hypothetical protein
MRTGRGVVWLTQQHPIWLGSFCSLRQREIGSPSFCFASRRGIRRASLASAQAPGKLSIV